MNSNDLGTALMMITKKAIVTMVKNHGLTPDYSAIEKRFKETYKDRFTKIIEDIQRDSKEADLFGQLERGHIAPLVNQVAKVTMQHGCVMYAKELLNLQ